MSEKNLYALMNDIETDFSEYEENSCSEFEKEKIKKNVMGRIHKKRRPGRWIAAACAIVAVAILGAGPLSTPVNAGVKLVSYYISEWFGSDMKEYEECINQGVTRDGVTVQLSSVVLDGNELTVAAVIDVGKAVNIEDAPSIDGCVYVNGRMASYGASGGTEQADEQTFRSVMTYSLKKDLIDSKDDMKIEIEMTDVTGDYAGKWSFAFTANGAKLAADTIHTPVNHTVTLPDGIEVTFTEMTQNAMGTKIYFKYEKGKVSYDLKLEGEDDLGNPLVFELKQIYEGEGYVYADPLSAEDNKISQGARELSLVPYAVKFPEESGRLSSDFEQTGDSFTVDLTSSTASGK